MNLQCLTTWQGVEERGAILSDCGSYRYVLTRRWDRSKPHATFIMLNPSTADAQQDDATIRKCRGFAVRLGMGALCVVNLFAYRATDPKALKAAGYPVGPENDFWIGQALDLSPPGLGNRVILAWGANAEQPGACRRAAEVRSRVAGHGAVWGTLERLRNGTPAHPLYLPWDCVEGGLKP